MRFVSLAVLCCGVIAVPSCDSPADPNLTTVSSGDDAAVPEALRAAYREDAARVAVRHLIATHDQAATDVAIPPELVAALYNALIHVHNARELAARDSVVDLYPIHTFPHPSVRRLDLGVERAREWVQALRAGASPTGNAQFDALMETYALTLERYLDFTTVEWDIAVLDAAELLNMTALAPAFEPIDGVMFSEPAGSGGDGNDIRATMESDAWRLDYSVGFGDCPAGCISRHTWTFRVFADGRVRYDGSSGPEPPAPSPRP